jgi:hypothetical protein
MAEEIKNEEVVEEVAQEEVDTQETTEQQPEKKYTQEELEEIIKARVAREKKATEKAVEEAAKLAKMNEEEKREFEYEKLQEELAELKRKDAYYGLSREASKMLAEHDIQANDEVLQFVVKDDAEGTQVAVNAFVELVNAKVEQGVQKALSGRTPKANVNANQIVTQEQFDKMGYSERVALKQKDENLYNKLKGE